MKPTAVLLIIICLGLLSFTPNDKKLNFQTDYYSPYCVDGDGWLRGRGCEDGNYLTLDQSNQIGKSHEQATRGHRWDNKFCR